MAVTVDAIVRNRRTSLIPPYPREELSEFWSFHPAGYRFMPKFKEGVWDGRIRMIRRNGIATGLFQATYREAEAACGVRFRIERDFDDPIQFRSFSKSDRLYQEQCVGAMKAATAGGGGIILSSTGTGKTFMAGMYCQDAIAKICFIVDELTLLKQAMEDIGSVTGERIGQVGDTVFEPERITCGTIQTLGKHISRPDFKRWMEELDVAIVDEMHVAINNRQIDVLDSMTELRAVFGLTATLNLRDDSVRMRAHALAGPVLFRYDAADGVEEEYLAKGAVFQLGCGTPLPVKGIKEYWDLYRAQVAFNPYRNAVVEEVVKAAIRAGRAVVVLVTLVDHLEELARRFDGIPLAVVKGSVKSDDRLEAKRRFEAGEFNLILTNKVFSKGVDIKRVDTIVDATAGKSEEDAVQRFGRGVRKHTAKRALVHVDIADRGGKFGRAADKRYRAFQRAGIPAFRLEWSLALDMDKVLQRAAKLAEEGTSDSN